jgi:hypothetical protein
MTATVIVANAEDDNSVTSQYRDPAPLVIAIPLWRIGSGAFFASSNVYFLGCPLNVGNGAGRAFPAAKPFDR